MMNFVYLIGCAETGEAAVVDPAWDVPLILELARQADLRVHHVLLTHSHPDHVNGLDEMLQATDATAYVHPDESSYMREVAARFGFSLDFMGRRSDRFQASPDELVVGIGKLALRFLHTPGHTPGSQCFMVEKNLFSGDTLFIGACGRVDLPGGDPQKMWWSLNRRLKQLDDDTIVYPGHNYSDRSSSTIGEQKRSNPCMQCDSLDQFLQYMRD